MTITPLLHLLSLLSRCVFHCVAVILGSVFGILLVIMVTMAVCVYKPLPRRWAARASPYSRTSPERLYLQSHDPSAWCASTYRRTSRAPLPTGARTFTYYRRTSTEGLCLHPHESREPLPTGARAQSASTYRCTSKERLYEPRDPLPTGARAQSASAYRHEPIAWQAFHSLHPLHQFSLSPDLRHYKVYYS
jgi:hypothetical protein